MFQLPRSVNYIIFLWRHSAQTCQVPTSGGRRLPSCWGSSSPPASWLTAKGQATQESRLVQTNSLRQDPAYRHVFCYHRDKRCGELERGHRSGRKRVSQYAQCEPEENESLFYLDRQALVGEVGESREEMRDHREQAERETQ